MSDPQPPASASAPTGNEMTTAETLTGIFFEPGRVFEALRERPRFLAAAIVMTIALFTFTTVFFQRVGFERMVTEAIQSSPNADQMSPEQKERAIQIQTSPVVKAIYYASPIIVVALMLAAGAGLYLLATMMAGKKMTYKQALAVWTYSSMPPTVLAMLLNLVLVFLKSPDDYDIVHASRRGLVQANLGLFVDPKASPVLATALGSIDLFAFYGLFLAALGLRKVARLSSGAAWGIVLTLWIIFVILRVAMAGATGGAM